MQQMSLLSALESWAKAHRAGLLFLFILTAGVALLVVGNAGAAPLAQATATPTAAGGYVFLSEPQNCAISVIGQFVQGECAVMFDISGNLYTGTRVIGYLVQIDTNEGQQNYEFQSLNNLPAPSIVYDRFYSIYYAPLPGNPASDYISPGTRRLYLGLGDSDAATKTLARTTLGFATNERSVDVYHAISRVLLQNTATVSMRCKSWNGIGPQANCAARVWLVYYAQTAPPTATPTAGAFSTALPTATQACITPTVQPSRTPRATSTAWGTAGPTSTGPAATNTPFPTPTGVITATATPTATGSSQIYVSEGASFTTSLNPWAKAGGFYVGVTDAAWSAQSGPDALSGTARLTYNTVSATITSPNAPAGGIVFNRSAGLPLPLRVVVDAKSDPAQVGRTNYLVLYVYGSGRWTRADGVTLSQNWQQRLQLLVQPGLVTGTVTAIALQVVSCPGSLSACMSSAAYTYIGFRAAALLDNVRVYGGTEAVRGSYPVCTDIIGGGPPQFKSCQVIKKSVNVFSCKPAASILDIGGGLEYLRCSVITFFTWAKQNDNQLTDLSQRQKYAEPWGSIADLTDAFGRFAEMITQLRQIAPANGETEAVSLNDIIQSDPLAVPDIHVATNDTIFWSDCNSVVRSLRNPWMAKGACFITYTLRDSLFIRILQVAMNVVSILFLLKFSWNVLVAIAGMT